MVGRLFSSDGFTRSAEWYAGPCFQHDERRNESDAVHSGLPCKLSFVRLFFCICYFMRSSDGLFSVTSVGATHHVEPEVAVSRFFSGGGFSDYVRRVYHFMGLVRTATDISCMVQFPRPSYQNEKVGAYMETLPEGAYSGLYNPYVTLLHRYQVTTDGVHISSAGRVRLISVSFHILLS